MKDMMGAFFGFTLFCVGALAVAMGVWGIFSNSSVIGGFLVFGGGAAALSGAYFASHVVERQSRNSGRRQLFVRAVFYRLRIDSRHWAGGDFLQYRCEFVFDSLASLGAAYSAWSVMRRSRLV